jgi:hypothetical protein
MSGYLQRLASSARNPDGGIHPLVGSLYSAPQTETAPAEPLAETRPSGSGAEPLAQPPVEPPPERVFAPLIEEPAGRPVTASQYPFFYRPADGSLTVDTEPPASRSSTGPVVELRRSASGLEPPVRPRQSRSGVTAQNPRSPKPALQPRAAPPREPDDIHIHIGRIEVAAVPAPAPRPAAPQPRKSLNLAEYLKRGRGRTS